VPVHLHLDRLSPHFIPHTREGLLHLVPEHADRLDRLAADLVNVMANRVNRVRMTAALRAALDPEMARNASKGDVPENEKRERRKSRGDRRRAGLLFLLSLRLSPLSYSIFAAWPRKWRIGDLNP
jgi:hypothetical protein